MTYGYLLVITHKKVFPPEVYTAFFGGDVKPSVPGDLV